MNSAAILASASSSEAPPSSAEMFFIQFGLFAGHRPRLPSDQISILEAVAPFVSRAVMPCRLLEEPMPEAQAVAEVRKLTRFQHVEDLQAALEEYAAFADGTITRMYGPPSPAPPGPRTGDEVAGTQERITHQNQEIDRSMRKLAIMAPLSHRLLHGYYRRPGPSGTPAACQEARGWETAVRYAGLVPAKADRLSRATFEVILEEAVGLLFVAHRARHVFRP